VSDVTEDTLSIDIVQDSDCNDDGEFDDPEPFVQNLVTLTFENNTNRAVTIRKIRANFQGIGFVTPNIATQADIAANGGIGTATVAFTSFGGGGKVPVGSGTALTSGTQNIQFTAVVRDEFGNEGTVKTSIGLDFQNFNNC
jgi:hypothetical protein